MGGSACGLKRREGEMDRHHTSLRVRTFITDADQGGRSDVAVANHALAVALCGVVGKEGIMRVVRA